MSLWIDSYKIAHSRDPGQSIHFISAIFRSEAMLEIIKLITYLGARRPNRWSCENEPQTVELVGDTSPQPDGVFLALPKSVENRYYRNYEYSTFLFTVEARFKSSLHFLSINESAVILNPIKSVWLL